MAAQNADESTVETVDQAAAKAADQRPGQPGQPEQLAAVTAVSQTAESIVLHVVSTGCTTIDSIEARVEHIADDRATLTFLQLVPDHCRRMPFSVRFEYSRASLGIEGKEVMLLNPLVSVPGRRRG